jgi:hypothetical protein
MNKKIKYTIYGIIVLIPVIIFIMVVYGGVVHVGVTEPHGKPTEYVLRTTMENSVRNHAKGIKVPDTMDLTDPIFARQFYGHYSAACRTCHGGPGKKPDPWMVIYPKAPDLTDKDVLNKWSEAELYWIIKNGIKNTGMMALGPTHPEEAIWGVTALVSQLPEMSAEEYDAMKKWFEEMQNQQKKEANAEIKN